MLEWSHDEAVAHATSHYNQQDEMARYRIGYEMAIAARNSRSYREALEANAPAVAREIAALWNKAMVVTAAALRATLASGEPNRRMVEARRRRYTDPACGLASRQATSQSPYRCSSQGTPRRLPSIVPPAL